MSCFSVRYEFSRYKHKVSRLLEEVCRREDLSAVHRLAQLPATVLARGNQTVSRSYLDYFRSVRWSISVLRA